MGKFNNDNNIVRSKQDIVDDYVDYLIKIQIIQKDDGQDYKQSRQDEVIELLLEKCYETEIYKGQTVSTVNAFYHFVNFILSYDIASRRSIWNGFVKRMFIIYEHNKNSCILASRGLGKSFFNFVLYPAFKMFLTKHTDFLLITNIPSQAIENLRILKNTIDANEILLEKKDNWKGKDLKWTERQIEYNGGLFHTRSLGTTPKGLHTNYVICDDIITDTTVYSYDEVENYVLGQAYPCVQRKRGRFIVSGTPLSTRDVYHVLMNDMVNNEGMRIEDGRISALGFYSIIFPVMSNKKSNYPEILTEEELEQIRMTQGDIKFDREYLLKAMDTAASLIKREAILACINKNYQPEEVPTGNNSLAKQYIIGGDVATSGAASADESAFIVLEIIDTRNGIKKIIRKAQFEKGMPITSEYDTYGKRLSDSELGQVESIQKLSYTFNNARTVIEKNNVGVALIQELQKRNVYVEEFITTTERKKDIVRYLISEINHKNIIFPEPDTEIQKLIDQISNFGIKINKQGKERMEALSGKDDGYMALAIANYMVQQSMSCAYAIVQD